MILLASSVFLLYVVKEVFSVRIIELEVPALVKEDDSVQMTCVFDMEGGSLYSLNWWKGNTQFYQFSPTSKQPMIVYNTSGINIDRERSGLTQLTLRKVSRESRGLYKCEIVAEFPSFERDTRSRAMEVAEVPDRPPRISVSKLYHNIGDVLEADCMFRSVDPMPYVAWYINRTKVKDYHSEISGPREGHRPGVMTSRLQLPLRRDLVNGRALLTCALEMRPLYTVASYVQLSVKGIERTEVSSMLSIAPTTVSDSRPLTAVVLLSSAAFGTIIPTV